MIERGKYQSLTMINWNGFFARTFDIDQLVTTLSGGNGAGKSTTMAAFITALIPDQSLLHFRNTTEAGSSQASRDKGLFGKLKPGVCFAALEVINSRKQRVIFAVKLQQIAGRDKKVDIKPFLVQGLPSAMKPTDLLIENVSGETARVRQINEVKQLVAGLEGVQFKAFNSVVEYHSLMFDLGVLPKKLRNSSDRSKFYRLIEASLYGGISSAITRSLRDYLLPQNGGVKKAFQDMESALRENRLTLDAIKTTQADRDLFKHLLTESTNYVASDYMRHANDREKKIQQVMSLRSELFASRKRTIEQTEALTRTQKQLNEIIEQESLQELDLQAASDHLQLVQSALRQQEKIERYQYDLEELSEQLEEQMMVVEEAQEQLLILEEETTYSEEEVDSLKSQLADYQQALDIQQTRALQYQQAVQALEKAADITGNPQLSVEMVQPKLAELKSEEQQKTDQLLATKHQLDLLSTQVSRFEKGLKLVTDIAGSVDREQVAEKAQQLTERLDQSERFIQNEAQWRSQLDNLIRDRETQIKAKALYQQYLDTQAVSLQDAEQIEEEKLRHQLTVESAEHEQDDARDERNLKKAQLNSLEQQARQLRQSAPEWIRANDALNKLQQQSGREFASAQSVMQYIQTLLSQEKQQQSEKEKLAERRETLEQTISKLASPGGSSEPLLKDIADFLGGVLLSEIYDDISVEDAPYFSAMYGPARHAIVVSDLSGIKQKLAELHDCPEDLYFIEGDVEAFDDSVFDAEELENAVCVRFSDKQLRYSRIPETSLFGRAAREQKLEALRLERDEVVENYAKASFEVQKLARLYEGFNQFIEKHIGVAFQPDPELALNECSKNINTVTQALSLLDEKDTQLKSAALQSKQAISLLDAILPVLRFVQDDSITLSIEELEQKLAELDKSKLFVSRHKKAINELKNYTAVLSIDPLALDEIEANHTQLNDELMQIKAALFALEDLFERRQYFAYADSVSILDKSSELNDQLKAKLQLTENQRDEKRNKLRAVKEQSAQYNQVLVSLKSAHQAKSETVSEFIAELKELGVQADEGALHRAESRKQTLQQQLTDSRTHKSECEKQITAIEFDLKAQAKGARKQQKNYVELRALVVAAKAGWCNVLHMAREHDVERRLYKREFAYKTADELRSLSDKSLGALRLAVADNETLRDALRASEDTARPERKVAFYISVYQHLRERIRQDIIHTDDPVEAIEEMEVELARLTEELTQRENRLAISSDSVASIINKTILREQNRIRMLNQGLSNINFGQVKGVRLNVNVRESHQILLNGLSEQQQQHKDLFESNRLTFSEAMAKLFQRVNPHIDMGQRSAQVLGEELLDYRNYLELSVEVNRGTDGWLQAESGALSTGEAIGTGQSILLMVVQSWEEESRRLRSKDIVPCRLLFLDEAARLDSKSISTLFELCDRLDMQLLIAAPENISPEKGTTYKLVRKVFKDHEHVHVVGLRGFGQLNSSGYQQQDAQLEFS
ncbi:chromosome partition protein MukB [Vibrio sp. SCSIO 43137]|uniref:chromosome partition protein MukB n=1 Tax=Vibrio sp. SCSIO 43137 TaxID=3021011 RepID=UPI002306F93D|nr:chromosome partition protein MukB [Vibrio sp. SCSIO 43137]WCE28552.1 chromosome partition protein MukB [Vibrio sp. SCSIO 43137]